MSMGKTSKNIYTIGPHAPFIDTLVQGILQGPLLGDWSRNSPFWLADVTIILPTQRARLALSSAFATALGGATILPDIRTLEGGEGDKRFFQFQHRDVFPKTISRIERQFLLCKLVSAWMKQQEGKSGVEIKNLHTTPARILSLAASLGDLIDEIKIEGIHPNALRALPTSKLDPTSKGDLAENFLRNLDFLEIALSYWPKELAQLGLIDQVDLQNLRIDRQIQNLAATYGSRPIIAAGSTGSVPSTARLLKAITELQRGCLVLPGVNISLSQQAHQDLLEDSNAPHGHSQYGLAQLLRRLNKTPAEIIDIAPPPTNNRPNMVRHALALAKDTANWGPVRGKYTFKDIEDATKTIGILIGRNEREQALAIALAARDSLAKNKSVGIISPDRNFSRRVAVELKRFDILVDDSAGTPLYHAPAGRLVRQILSVALSNFSGVNLMSLLRAQHVRFTYGQKEISSIADLLEFALLRGQRPQQGLAGLRNALDANLGKTLPYPSHNLTPDEGILIENLFEKIEKAFEPLLQLLAIKNFKAAKLALTLVETMRVLAPLLNTDKNYLSGANQLHDWVKELEGAHQGGPSLNASDTEAVLQTLMAPYSVRAPVSGRNDIFIWGRLEARMQSADLMILCSLNEGIWPEIADPGPWLSRGMRLNAGLAPPERQQGLAAHDFEMAIGHSDVMLAYSERVGTGPVLPSRLLERFCGFLGDEAAQRMEMRGSKWVRQARQLDASAAIKPASRPMPKPAAHLRPRALSITEIETLIRSPFDLYAKHILKLAPVNPLGEDISARERGNLIHEVFAQFVQENLDANAPDAHDKMMQIAERVFAQMETQPDRRDIWLRRLAKSAQGFLKFEQDRDKDIYQRYAEQDLLWVLQGEAQGFQIKGKADRIDMRHDGGLEILDYKTGSIPDKSEMVNFLAPQLLVEAAITKANGFSKTPPAPTHRLAYIKIGADPAAFTPKDFSLPNGLDINQTADRLMINIQSRISAFLLSDHLAMTARIMPKTNQRFSGPYDQLARTAEWSQAESEGDIS